MMQASAANSQWVHRAIQAALLQSSETTSTKVLHIEAEWNDTPLTVSDARCIIACLRENPHRFHTLRIYRYTLLDHAVLNVLFCNKNNGLAQCTGVTKVELFNTRLGTTSTDDADDEGSSLLQRLVPAFYNTSVTTLDLDMNEIQGRAGGDFFRNLLRGNCTLKELILFRNAVDEQVARGIQQGLFATTTTTTTADNNNNTTTTCCCHLHTLNLYNCHLGNRGLANLLPLDDDDDDDDDNDGMMNNNNNINPHLTHLDLGFNDIHDDEGGRNVSLLLQRLPCLQVLVLNGNRFGPLGAEQLATGLATARHLESLSLRDCQLENAGVASLVPPGQVNRSWAHLDLRWNIISDVNGGESVAALAARCTNLDRCDASGNHLDPDHRRRLDLLLDRKRQCTDASALAGSSFSVLFRAVEEFHRHEHGLSAIFLILQNDGNDYFCNAITREL
jgi:Leucine Rich repeat